MSKMQTLYLGQAGHLLVMSELLYRGWNVAIPQVDRGDDIFVVKDANGELKRVQVKTSSAKTLKRDKGHSAKFNLRIDQLQTPYTPDLHYVFVMRTDVGWSKFVVIDRSDLWDHRVFDQIGYEEGGKLQLQIRVKNNTSVCSKIDFSKYVNNWNKFPVINH